MALYSAITSDAPNSRQKELLTVLILGRNLGVMCESIVGFLLCRSFVVEYDKDTKQFTVWYKGKHVCTPKPDMKSMKNYFDTLLFKSILRLTHTELKNDCM